MNNVSIKGGILVIGEVPIDDKIFQEDKVNYIPVDREEQIDDLIMFIAETRYSIERQSDVFLMKEDLKYLMNIDDEVVFSSILTNEYIAQSKNPDKFKEICLDILIKNGLTKEGAQDALSGECLY